MYRNPRMWKDNGPVIQFWQYGRTAWGVGRQCAKNPFDPGADGIEFPGINQCMFNASLFHGLPCIVCSHTLGHSIQGDLHAGSVEINDVLFNADMLPANFVEPFQFVL